MILMRNVVRCAEDMSRREMCVVNVMRCCIRRGKRFTDVLRVDFRLRKTTRRSNAGDVANVRDSSTSAA